MKNLVITVVVFLIALILWSVVGMKKVNKTDYISQTVLDMSKPLGVTIDVEFIKGLNPANGK
jgi:hypothetical protein